MLSLRGASSLAHTPFRPSTCSSRCISNISHRTARRSHPTSLVPRRPVNTSLRLYKPLSTSIQRYADTPGISMVELKHEQELAHRKLRPHPDQVSTTSSVHQVFHEKGEQIKEETEPDMLAGVWSDLRVIKDTFALYEVPREALVIGMAGVLPYLGTSLATTILAWDINHAAADGTGLLLSEKSAQILLDLLEPLQIGYGAVIISFLGAIHWGLEWAKFGGSHGYRRYAYGVVAPAIAWPTILMPIEYALITQFLSFTMLYFADARAVVKGWAPHWYSTYRFVLTFVVGTSIVISLIGRGEIADKMNRMPGPADRIRALKNIQAESLAEEERVRRARALAEAEAGDDEDDEEMEEE